MKKIFLLLSSIFIFSISHGQYIPATGLETSYGTLLPSSCSFNDVGTDTRSAGGSSIFGYGSGYYANYLNVTANSCLSTAWTNPTFYWSSSLLGTSGSWPLTFDAQDPDVVLVSPATSNAIWAIAVYYSAAGGGYYMSYAQFNTGTGNFTPMTPLLIQPYTPSPGYQPHINIDSDNFGHYSVIFQMDSWSRSLTQNLVLIPTVPTNPVNYSSLIEPDIACLGNSAFQSVIIGLTPSKNRYRTFRRNYLGGSTMTYNSSWLNELFQPRIAAPSSGIFNEYAITVARKYPVGPNTKFDIIFQIDEGTEHIANDGSIAGFPSAINLNNSNIFPCLSYTYNGLSLNERVSLAWHTEGIPGILPLPNQGNTFIGLDIIPDPFFPISTTPTAYMDISNVIDRNNESAMAISGRYIEWGKSAAFTYSDIILPGFGAELIWKLVPSGASWKTEKENNVLVTVEKTKLITYPNPAQDEVNIDLINNVKGYQYEIFNQVGQSILKKEVTGNKLNIPLNNWASGMYFIKLENKETKEISKLKFMKE